MSLLPPSKDFWRVGDRVQYVGSHNLYLRAAEDAPKFNNLVPKTEGTIIDVKDENNQVIVVRWEAPHGDFTAPVVGWRDMFVCTNPVETAAPEVETPTPRGASLRAAFLVQRGPVYPDPVNEVELAANDDELCEQTRRGWYCSRKTGHLGDHMAYAGDDLCAIWDDRKNGLLYENRD